MDDENPPETGNMSAEAPPVLVTEAVPVELDDVKIRLIGIPFFGILNPQVTGLFGHIKPNSYMYWIGFFYFILISFLLWQGNRYFLIKQRQYYDWFNHPVRKVMLVLFANAFYTAPLTALMLYGWYQFAGFSEVNWTAIKIVTLMNVICVIFVTHIYETVYLIRERESDAVRVEKLEKAKLQAELDALKNQIDPHFMFNSLNTLSYLIENDSRRALEFNQSLSDVYRYILAYKNRGLVFLSEELEFMKNYAALLRLRFDEKIVIDLPDLPGIDELLIPPISLQILLENAVKHNEFSSEKKLHIRFRLYDGFLEVSNDLRPKTYARPSARIGLNILRERYRLLMSREVEVLTTDTSFVVRLPLKRIT